MPGNQVLTRHPPFLNLFFRFVSLPHHTSVSDISMRHAHKVFIKCPVSKLRLRLQTVETGHYFCSLMPLRNGKKPRQIPRAKIHIGNEIQKGLKKSCELYWYKYNFFGWLFKCSGLYSTLSKGAEVNSVPFFFSEIPILRKTKGQKCSV